MIKSTNGTSIDTVLWNRKAVKSLFNVSLAPFFDAGPVLDLLPQAIKLMSKNKQGVP